jgi:hypothetical protein
MRIALAAILLVVFVVMAVRLTPPFFHNRELQVYLDQSAASQEDDALPLEILRIRVLNKARQIGLPVRGDQVRVTRGDAGLSIDIRYVVPVDFYFWTIDLHFHPRAGAR